MNAGHVPKRYVRPVITAETAQELLEELCKCTHHDPSRRGPYKGRWTVVNVPAPLWEKIFATYGVKPKESEDGNRS